MNSDFISNSRLNNPCWKFLTRVHQGIQSRLSGVEKQPISESSIALHNKAFEQVRKIEKIAHSCDQKSFNDPEFLYFVKLRNDFAQEIGDFEGLKQSLRLFRVAIEAKNSFMRIEQIELLYRSSKQQEFYNLVFELLAKNVDKVTFYKQVHKKLNEVIEQVKTDNGRQALHSYIVALDTVSKQDELGLRLLYLFKKYQLTNYSILKNVSDLVTYLEDKDLQNIESIISLVKSNQDIFNKVGRIIEVPLTKSAPLTYARMLQYVALRHKYKTLYYQFKKLKKVLYTWCSFYQVVNDVRRQHPQDEYEQPKEFRENIPGLNTYNKYKKYLK